MNTNVPGKGMLRGHVEPTANRTASLSCSSCCASTFFPTSALLINVIPSAANKSTRRCTIYGDQRTCKFQLDILQRQLIYKLNIHKREMHVAVVVIWVSFVLCFASTCFLVLRMDSLRVVIGSVDFLSPLWLTQVIASKTSLPIQEV